MRSATSRALLPSNNTASTTYRAIPIPATFRRRPASPETSVHYVLKPHTPLSVVFVSIGGRRTGDLVAGCQP